MTDSCTSELAAAERPKRSSASPDLADQLSELAAMLEALQATVDSVSENARALRAILPGASLGPIDGMDWMTGTLACRVRSMREVAAR